MKQYKVLLLLCYILCSAVSCKKDINSVASMQNTLNTTSSADNIVSADNIDARMFVKGINNPYLPYVPGTRFHYINLIVDGKNSSYENTEVTVTSDIKYILGVACQVIHDVVKQYGKVMEDTYDWYAQDKQGNVWYFGEDTKARTDTGWSTEGSWEAGVNGAKAGIIMFANPQAHIGQTYYQEFLVDLAEDQATLLNVSSTVHVRYGTFSNCVETKEFTRLTPGEIEHKYYAYGVGQVLTTLVKGGIEREELINVVH
jgi:hypothetical protein